MPCTLFETDTDQLISQYLKQLRQYAAGDKSLSRSGLHLGFTVSRFPSSVSKQQNSSRCFETFIWQAKKVLQKMRHLRNLILHGDILPRDAKAVTQESISQFLFAHNFHSGSPDIHFYGYSHEIELILDVSGVLDLRQIVRWSCLWRSELETLRRRQESTLPLGRIELRNHCK